MKTKSRSVMAILAVAMTLTSSLARAVLSINEPWVRAAADGRSAEVFVRLKSSESATLVGVDSFAARTTAIRAPAGKGPLSELPLPANVLVALQPGGVRLGLNGLVRRLKPGEHVPITLIVRSAAGTQQEFYINAEVRRHSPSDDELNPRAQHQHRKWP